MFIDDSFKKYKIDENNTTIGEIEVNESLINATAFYRPFVREVIRKDITKIGNRNYEALNQFIINSMQDYYNRLISTTPSERKRVLDTYTRLYGMWKELHNYKKSNNLVEMDKIYDLFSYELYVLGYQN